MALENYVEMMDRTGDPDFRKAKAVENALENSALGSRFRSRYAMVCYGGGRQPGGVQYDDALQLGKQVVVGDGTNLGLLARVLDTKAGEVLLCPCGREPFRHEHSALYHAPC